MTDHPPEVALWDLVTAAVGVAGLGEPTRLVPLAGGQLSDVLAVHLTSERQVVAKVYTAQWAWKQAKEVHVLTQMRSTMRDELPEVIWAGTASARAVTLLSRLPGVPLSSVVDDMDPAQRRAVYRQIGRFARRLHTVVQPAYGYVVTEVLDPLQTNQDHMMRQFAKKTGELERLDEGVALAAAITEVVSRHRDIFDASPGPVLCHNDLHEGNVLVSEHRRRWRVRGVVDVENAVAADPLLDLAKTDYYSVRGDSAKHRGLQDGYGRLGRSGPLRLDLYRLYHALDLYTWFATQGDDHLLPPIRSDLQHSVASLATG